jgi:transcriptional regulator with XRE-family HTH domain
MDRPRETARTIAKRFGGRLKAGRRAAGMTQDQLADAIEFSPISLSKLETGTSSPSFEVFVALALALDVRPDFLAGLENAELVENAERRALLDQLALAASKLDAEWIKQLLDIAEKATERR